MRFRSLFRRRRPIASGSDPDFVLIPYNPVGGAHEFVRVRRDETIINGNSVQIEANEYRIDGNAKN